MCSQKMDNYQGDLTDIIRATSGSVRGDRDAAAEESDSAWQFPSISVNFPEDFGDPFIHLRDPLLHDIQNPAKVSKFEAVFINEELKRPPDIFSRMLQISPDSNPLPPPTRHFPVDSLQISTPRNAGIKRRKNQAKKVVCIPAPAPANSRPSGEIVPSDLWAWRKYGQKPIKGSPYPRGYYRCSSSKGCSARKQVERSRTDPNMLVITYTSEHNHPWPTQRNALAGSTRSQPSKNAIKNQQTSQRFKEEINPENAATTSTAAAVKQEGIDPESENGIQNTYKPALPDSSNSEDNFFADLGGIETESLDILFAQGFSGDEGRVNEDLDPFSFYDWHGSNNNISTIPSTEDKRDS